MAARKRKTGETFKSYRESLRQESRWLNDRLKGRMFWPADRGTYQRGTE